MMRILLIDNYDSFTFNLAHLVAEVAGELPLVLRNDALDLAELARLDPAAVIISPGPGRPDRPGDFGICAQAFAVFPGPILGVCLGHQGLAVEHGGAIDYAATVMHGRPSRIRHDDTGLFRGLPQHFQAIRYHSLLVTRPGAELVANAFAEDGTIMGLRHQERPVHGVQFHPESVATENGAALLRNFLAEIPKGRPWLARQPISRPARTASSGLRIFTRELAGGVSPERCFAALYGDSADAFWLDSAAAAAPLGRWSFMGDASGPLAERISYRVAGQELLVNHVPSQERLFDALARWLMERRIERPAGLDVPCLPGWVGYLGYELKADAGAAAAHQAATPDARLIFADRIVAFDHLQDRIVLLAADHTDAAERAAAWFDAIAPRIREAPALPPPRLPATPLRFAPHQDDRTYLAQIHAAKEAIRRGESYEVCLTNELVAHGEIEPLAAYRRLRQVNPAPFAAFLRFGDLAVLSSSPERFLRIGPDGAVEARPIKGTIRRGRDAAEDGMLARQLATSVKDRSEHLMIVDLLRNDLGRVCEAGSVRVEGLFAIEPYATVHQMVSTVHGRLAAGSSPIDCIEAAFPGGSMTGAPKLRTMAILDELEGRPRGIYSGAIGYIGLDGSVDLSIVIRTAVLQDGTVRIGAGGAIVDLSDPAEELAELRLKCTALLTALGGSLAAETGESG
ncbi:aminodeoxychorismate synthase component I [Geminicoccus flavidas]|uniref:aminodeoxychorismate synthase component I n=1 Tax=Geminicoccus flavidas TaxID=2506407 RepID=UPI00190F97B0|nr:aminodeoxychorismate synthase component I [Geminicoccus flavidas]